MVTSSTSPSRPPLGRHSPIPEEMKVGARHLRALAATFDAHIPTDQPLARPGLRAEADMTDRSLDGAWGRATFEVVHDVAPHVSYASDHMQGMAVITTAPGVVFSVSTLSRTVLETLARTCWLYEPGLETRERVRRVFNVRLESLREELNVVNGIRQSAQQGDGRDDGTLSTRRRIGKIMTGAKAAGFTFVTKPSRLPNLAPARYLERPVPSAQRLISEMFKPLASSDGRPDLGPIMHRLTSATAHGQSHGLHHFVLGRPESIRGVDGLADVQFGLGLPHFTTLVGGVVLAVQATAARLCAYYGWPIEAWQKVLGPAVDSMGTWLKVDRDEQSRL